MSFLTITPIVQSWEAHTASGRCQCVPRFQRGLIKDPQRRLEKYSRGHYRAAFL